MSLIKKTNFFFILLIFCISSLFADNYQTAEKGFYNEQYAFAIHYYEKEILDNGFYREESFYKVVLAYLQLNNIDKAKIAIKDYLTEYPQGQYFLKIKLHQANLLLTEKNYGAVLNLAKSMIEKHPDKEESNSFYILLYKVYLEKGFEDLAMESLEKANSKYEQEANVAKGLYYYEQKDYTKASRFFRYIKLDELVSTSHKDVLYYRAKSYHHLGDYEESRREIQSYLADTTNQNAETVAEISPKIMELNFLLFENFFLEKKYSKSILGLKKYIASLKLLLEKKLDRSIKKIIANYIAQSHYILGRCYLELEQPILALKQVEKILEDADLGDAFRDKALWLQYSIYQNTNKREKMIECLEQIIAFYRRNPPEKEEDYLDALEKILIESTFIKKYKYSPYLNDFEKQITNVNDRLELYGEIANHFYSNEQKKQSLIFFKKLFNITEDLSYLKRATDILLENNEYTEIILYLKKNQTIKNEITGYQNNLIGYCYFQEKNYSSSYEYYQKNLNHSNPTYQQEAYYFIGKGYLLTAKSEKAFKMFLEYVDLFVVKSKYYAEVVYELGKLENEFYKNHDKAIRWFNEAKKYYSNQNEVYYQIGLSHFFNQDHVQALGNLDKVTTNTPYVHLEATFLKGKSYFQVKNYQQAIQYYFKVLTAEGLLENHPELKEELYYELALTYLAINSYQEFNYYLNTLKEDFPESKYYTKGIYHLTESFYKRKQYAKLDKWMQNAAINRLKKEDKNYIYYLHGLSYLDRKQLEYFKQVQEKLIENDYEDKYYFELLKEHVSYLYEGKQLSKAKEEIELLLQNPKLPENIKTLFSNYLININDGLSEKEFINLESPYEQEDFVEQNKNSTTEEKKYYSLAEQYFKSKEYADALSQLDLISESDSPLYRKSLTLKIRIHLKQKKFERVYDDAINLIYSPSVESKYLEFGYYVLIQSAKKNGDTENADLFLEKLKAEFSESKYLKLLQKKK